MLLDLQSLIIMSYQHYVYNRAVAAKVLSWATGLYDNPSYRYEPEDITGIAIKEDFIWYQINYTRAIPIHREEFEEFLAQITEYEQVPLAA